MLGVAPACKGVLQFHASNIGIAVAAVAPSELAITGLMILFGRRLTELLSKAVSKSIDSAAVTAPDGA